MAKKSFYMSVEESLAAAFAEACADSKPPQDRNLVLGWLLECHLKERHAEIYARHCGEVVEAEAGVSG